MNVSTNICKTGEFKDAIFYEAICSCQATNHNQTLIVEYDPEVRDVNLQIYSRVLTPQWTSWDSRYEYQEALGNGDFYGMAYYKFKLIVEHIFAKLKFTMNIWLKGYVEVENQFMFRNEQAIDDYVNAILSAKTKIKENQNGRDKGTTSPEGN